jgi:hypothetical protein
MTPEQVFALDARKARINPIQVSMTFKEVAHGETW